MANVNGKLINVGDPTIGDAPEIGTVSIALCGYGAQVPRSPGGIIVNLEIDITPPNPPDSVWNAVVAGNDVIIPAGTYYTVTYKNQNGDIAQVMAYSFQDSGVYNLAFTPPFDPNQPPPPLPEPVTNLLLVVPYSATPEFPGDVLTSWQITLAGDATASFTNLIDGNLYTIIIIQDANGEHSFYWPTNVYNATPVNPDPNGMTVQTFVAVSDNLYPIGAGTYYP